jgi:hypothetical protein
MRPRNGLSVLTGMLCVAAVCCVSTSERSGEVLAEKEFVLGAPAEVVLGIRASAPGSDWGVDGREAPVVTVTVDGEYVEDIVLVGGEETLDYRVLLGPVTEGQHRLCVLLNEELSSPGARQVEIAGVTMAEYRPGDDLYDVVAHAPFIYYRRWSVDRSTDVPMVAYHQRSHSSDGTRIRYTVIFTHEDGGTLAPMLMSRWGRTTDIELIYDVVFDANGKIVRERFQGPGHATPPFKGRKLGAHPLLRVCTSNNMVTDEFRDGPRVALAPVDELSPGFAREAMMDANPWTYRAMAAEMRREGRTESPGDPATAAVSDPRNYLYCDLSFVGLGRRQAIVEVQTSGGGSFLSNHGQPGGAVTAGAARDSWSRAAVELPEGTGPDDIERVDVKLLAGNGAEAGGQTQLAGARCLLLGSDYVMLPALATVTEKRAIPPAGLVVYER